MVRFWWLSGWLTLRYVTLGSWSGYCVGADLRCLSTIVLLT